MSVERSSDEPFLAGAMRRLTGICLKSPLTTIVVASVLALVATLYTTTNLGFKTSRSDLLDPNSSYNKLWLEYLDEFGSAEDAVIVVEGQDQATVVAALQDAASSIARDDQLFSSVLTDVDLTVLRSKGLFFLSPAELAGVKQFTQEAYQTTHGEWFRLQSNYIISGLLSRWQAAQASAHGDQYSDDILIELQRYVGSLSQFLNNPTTYQSPWPDMVASTISDPHIVDGKRYLLADEGRVGFILLHLNLTDASGDAFTQGSEAIDRLRTICKEISYKYATEGISLGLTGIPVLEDDEMRASKDSMLWASVISFFAVALIFMAGFGGIRHAVMANMVLLIGMAWAFAYVTLVVGHLNILSVSFAVTMIGIGIDYGVYYVARYMRARPEAESCTDALLKTAGSVGPAILAGAVTTAIAFLAAGWTSFPGVAELGIIAGGGILFCALAQLFILPAVILYVDKTRLGERLPTPLPIHRWIGAMMQTPRTLLFASVAITILLAFGLPNLWYDHNLLNLQVKGQESVELERRLSERCGQSMWYAISMADTPEELLARKAEFQRLSSVERVEEIISQLPTDIEYKTPVIAQIGHQLANLPDQADQIPVPSPEQLHAMVTQAIEFLQRSAAPPAMLAEMQNLQATIARISGQEYYLSLSMFQQATASDLLQRLQGLHQVANTTPPTLDDLPASLVDRYVGQNQRHLLKVYGRGDLWEIDNLELFVNEVRSVDPKVTGNPLQAFEATHEMKGSYERAALYAMVIIFSVLIFDLRSLRYAALAALPLGVGILQTFGILGLLGVPLNPANLIALPLILGISVDEGVHVVHDYLEQKHGRYKMSPSAAVGVTVDALTTIVGFGSLMIASHEGLQSLGRVLTIGITCCTFTSLVMLPALLTIMTWNRAEAPASDAETLTPDKTASPTLRRTDPLHEKMGDKSTSAEPQYA